MTADDAWDGLSLGELRHCTARAKKNDIRNTAEFAKFNKRCPLSPSVEDLSSEWSPRSGLDVEAWRILEPRRVVLQRWKRYRYDHPRACGGEQVTCAKKAVPNHGRPFRIAAWNFLFRPETVASHTSISTRRFRRCAKRAGKCEALYCEQTGVCRGIRSFL